jgi:CheY-like chemotaxis protein
MPPPVPRELRSARLLIVDNQEDNIALLEQTLRGAGYAAVTATTDPASVAELHRANRYDLILLDLQMPGTDGFAVMAALRALAPGSGELPVLVITAQPEQRQRALEAGAKDFLVGWRPETHRTCRRATTRLRRGPPPRNLPRPVPFCLEAFHREKFCPDLRPPRRRARALRRWRPPCRPFPCRAPSCGFWGRWRASG